jgi:LuxR family maltose regulon positive regulatory protein
MERRHAQTEHRPMVIPAQGAWAALDPLLATKLHSPRARPDRVPRPHLIEVLENALSLGHGLILVAAPAGFGKTTIVADWLRATERAAAWLSLDKGDSDPALFWRYVIAALQTVDDALGRSAQAALATPLQAAQALPLAPLVVSLINDLAQAAAPIALVLDDYHVIDSEPVHASLSYFVDHLPPRAHLIVATRADPPLDLPRRRSRNQVTELRVADLRFTGAEADAFLNARMGLNLPAGDVASLEGRTEGWIAGLQLAALSLRQQSDRHAFVAAFAGDDRYIADYLLEEILYRQPAALQTFLLQTAILERLCGPLCNAVTGRADSAEMLAHLEQANLFLDPLDSRRTWYRYHALFADLLRRRLRQAVEAPGVAALHRRASAWYEREGFVAEAVAAALAAPDPEYAADLLQRHVLALFFRSDTTLIHGWLKTLPEPVLRARPLLAAVYANTLAHTGAARPEALRLTGEWLCVAEDALAGAARSAGPPEDLIRSFLALSRAYLAAWRQDPPQQVITLTEQALAGLPPAEDAARDPNYLRLRSGLCNNLAAAYRALGDDEAALRAFAEARRIGERCGDYLNAHAAVSGLCQLLRKAGRLPDAAAVCREALAPQGAAETDAGPQVPGAGITYTALGRILLEWNDLAAAEAALTRGLALSQLIAAPATQHYGRMALAYLQQARGESAAALETIARQAARAAAPPPRTARGCG